MKTTDVPTPGPVSNSFALRAEVVKALSTAQVQSRISPSSKTAQTLGEFFRACAELCEAMRPAAPPDPAPKPKSTPQPKGTTK